MMEGAEKLKNWKYPLVCFLYVLPPLFWDSFFERVTAFAFILFWALLVLAGAVNMLLRDKLSVVKSGVISALLAGLLIGVTVGAMNWTPVNFNLLTEMMYMLAPLFILYPPIVSMLKNDKEAEEYAREKTEETGSPIN